MTSCQTADVIEQLAVGVVFMGVDEVIFTPPSPLEPFPPSPLNPPIVLKPNLRNTSPRAAMPTYKRARETFDLRLIMVRYK